MTPELLVLEPAPYGHGREWLLHLAAYARRCEPVPRLAFAVAPPVAEALRRELALAPVPGLSIHALTEREVAGCTQPKLALSALARWQVMRRLLRRTGARHGFFLELDHLSLPLALGLPLGGGRSVSGILFRPSVHYETAARRAGDARREARKNLLYRAMLRHRAVARVHTLDDAFPDFARTRYRDGGKVTALVDPAFPPVAPTVADRALAERAPEDRALFALFGVLSERKGVLALLRALAVLDEAAAGRTAVIVAGVVESGIRAALDEACAALARARPSLWFHLEDRHIRDGEIAALIDRSHAVLAPYQRFVGSSGILMWAASRGRPVIAQDYGLVGRLVHEHHLGLVTDSTDPAALANAMADAVETERSELCDCEQMAAFAASRTPEAFAAAILDPLRPTAGHHGNSRRETAVVLQNSDSRPAAATAGTD